MAVLQSIRSRGGIIVSIVIGLAMLAFIVGDALSSGSSLMSSSKNKVGEVAGEGISIQDFETAVKKNEEIMKSNTQRNSLSEEQQTTVREQTWQTLIMRSLMEQEYAQTGIDVSNEELFDLTVGDNMLPMVFQMFGNADTIQIREYIKSIDAMSNTDPQKKYWLNFEEEIISNRKIEKYSTLLTKALYATDAEVELAVANNTRKADISFIIKPYSSIADSTISVSDSEIKAYYKSHAPLFQQGDSRSIAYVRFDIIPSTNDYSETESWIKKLIPEFESVEDAGEYVDQLSDTKNDASYYKKEEISNVELAEFAFSGNSSVFGPYLDKDAYHIARLVNTQMLPDSVRARHILISSQQGYAKAKEMADSLANELRRGANFETVAASYSVDESSAVNGGDLGWFDARQMVQPFSDSAFMSKVNEIKVVETNYGFHILQVREKTPLVKKVRLAIVSKEVVPSTATINDIYGKARSFALDVNTTEDFQNKVQEQNLIPRRKTIGKNDKSIDQMPNTRDLIRQIYLMEDENNVVISKDGSNIFDTNTEYIIAVLTGINKEGTASINNVAAMIKAELVRQKKAEMIAKEMEAAKSGSESFLSLAQKMNLEIKSATDVTYNSFQVTGAGMEPKMVAAASLAEIGTISKPIDGMMGVIMFSVDNAEDMEKTAELNEQAKASLQQAYKYRTSIALQAIEKNGNIQDFRYRFY